MLKEIVIAIQSYVEAHQFIVKNKLWKWILIPGFIYALLFSAGMYFLSKSSTQVIDYFTGLSAVDSWLQTFQTGWLGFLFTFTGIIFWLVQIIFYFSLFRYMVLIIGSPVFAYLSKKTEVIHEGKNIRVSFLRLGKYIRRAFRLALRNCLWQSFYMIGLLLLSLVPVIGWITPIIALMVECYYFGFSMIDNSFERQKITVFASMRFISNHKGLAIGNGMLFYLMHLVLIIGWILAPAYAVIAATLSLYKVKSS